MHVLTSLVLYIVNVSTNCAYPLQCLTFKFSMAVTCKCLQVVPEDTYLCRFMQVSLWIQPVSKPLAKSFIYKQFSASPGYPSLFYTLRERALGASSARVSKLHTDPLKKWLPCTAIRYRRVLSIANPFQGNKIPKASSIKNILHLTTTQHTDLVIEL